MAGKARAQLTNPKVTAPLNFIVGEKERLIGVLKKKKKEGSKPKERKVLGEGESKESLPASGRKKSTPGGHSAGDHERFIYERTLGYSTRP